MSTGKRTIEFTLNGRAVSADVAPHWNMVEMLQGAFGMTGARESCGQGLCGCCTVLIDGEAVTGCLQLATLVDGKSVETIEGMANGSKLHPLQRKFIEHAALQCGICTPGFLMAAKALLEVNPNPTETQIRFWLAGNLCRCTGYDKIVRAVQDAAAEIRGETT